jgi:hypothetical protein
MSMFDAENTERLGRALAQRAETRQEFIGSAFALWREQNNGKIEDQLKCSTDAVWRLAVTPMPASDGQFVETVMSLAVSYGANSTALVRLLRWAETVSALRGTGQGDGLLKAALDVDPEETP